MTTKEWLKSELANVEARTYCEGKSANEKARTFSIEVLTPEAESLIRQAIAIEVEIRRTKIQAVIDALAA